MNRILVGAGYGLRDWIAQRATAVIMVVYTLVMIVAVLAVPSLDYAAWRAFMGNGFIGFLSFLFAAALAWHVWIGVRDIWMDYVKPTGLRLTLHVITATLLVGYVAWAARILWRL